MNNTSASGKIGAREVPTFPVRINLAGLASDWRTNCFFPKTQTCKLFKDCLKTLSILYIFLHSNFNCLANATATNSKIPISISLNQSTFQTGDIFTATIEHGCADDNDIAIDVYVTLANHKDIFFISSEDKLVKLPVSWQSNINLSELQPRHINIVVDLSLKPGDYTAYALVVKAGQNIYDTSSWLSDLASTPFQISLLDIQLETFRDETYLFPASHPVTGETKTIPVQKWDIFFLGNDPAKADISDSDLFANVIIPGNFSHIAVYLGRDEQNRPCAMELTTKLLTRNLYSMSLIYLPEQGETYPPEPDDIQPAMPKDIRNAYSLRWAKRLESFTLARLKAAESLLFKQIQKDWESRIPYQLEIDLEKAFFDREISLIDDGLANGTNCTDYWLSIFEVTAGACIKGSRITAAELEKNYRTNPEGNIFISFDLGLVKLSFSPLELLNNGFVILDPPPHVFTCDGTPETGLPVPDRLFTSPQLEEIAGRQ